jgi:hypothetical protein
MDGEEVYTDWKVTKTWIYLRIGTINTEMIWKRMIIIKLWIWQYCEIETVAKNEGARRFWSSMCTLWSKNELNEMKYSKPRSLIEFWYWKQINDWNTITVPSRILNGETDEGQARSMNRKFPPFKESQKLEYISALEQSRLKWCDAHCQAFKPESNAVGLLKVGLELSKPRSLQFPCEHLPPTLNAISPPLFSDRIVILKRLPSLDWDE